jgi:ribosome-associated protein
MLDLFDIENDIEFHAIRAQGPGGQHVNKASTAIHLRVDIKNSSLPDSYKHRLLRLNDQRITKEGVIVIKSQKFRSLEKNKAEALRRLQELIERIAVVPKKRKSTKPSRGAVERRLTKKNERSKLKGLRQKVSKYDG